MRRTVLATIAVAALVMGSSRQILSHETLTTTVLFDREIVRVLNAHCVMCHAEGGPSFPLETYEQTWLQRRKIRAAVIARHMPPWPALPGYGRFANSNVVTLRESQFVVSWVEGLGPRNAGTVFTNTADPSGSKQPPVRAHADFGTWHLGEPDLTRRLAVNVIDAQQPNVVKRTIIDLGLDAARRVRALEYMPGDRRVVRAAFFTVQETGQWIGSWTPWDGGNSLPPGVAFRLPASSHVVAEIHYRGGNERIEDRGTVGLFFADESGVRASRNATGSSGPAPPGSREPRGRGGSGDGRSAGVDRTVTDIVVEANGGSPSGSSSRRFHAERILPAATELLAMWPEIGPGIQSVEVTARKPSGSSEVLLFAKDIPLDWPTPYVFKDPVIVPAGTTLNVTAYFANGKGEGASRFRLTLSTCRPLRVR